MGDLFLLWFMAIHYKTQTRAFKTKTLFCPNIFCPNLEYLLWTFNLIVVSALLLIFFWFILVYSISQGHTETIMDTHSYLVSIYSAYPEKTLQLVKMDPIIDFVRSDWFFSTDVEHMSWREQWLMDTTLPTVSDSFILMVILLTASDALLIILRKPAPLSAWVFTALGSWK